MAEPRIVDISGIIEPFKERVVTLRATAAANPYALDTAIMINECLNDLERLPVIKSEAVPVVHGRWVIETIDKKERKISATCSECEAFFSLGLFDFGLCYNYCPNCGAKMDKED